MPTKIILKVVSGPIQGTEFPIETHDTFLFGRHGSCHARLPKDPLLSRHHFLLEVNPPDARLCDLGSLNGTFVNAVKYGGRSPTETPAEAAERKYPEVDLCDGDRITVGNTTIQVRIVLPLRCCQCDAEVPEADRTLAEWTPGVFLCSPCRSAMLSASGDSERSALPATVDYVPRCQHCGRDVSREVRNGRRGDYVCDACRDELVSQAGGLRRWMLESGTRPHGPAGPSIGGYEIGDELGKGGMGVVYRATRREDGQEVAVKVMLARIAVDESARQLFLREIEVVRGLRHPHIVSLLEAGSAGSAFYFVMEYCNRGSADQLMKRQRGRLSLGMAAPLMLQCLDGLG